MRDKSISPYFVGVDVGTSCVRCVVGSVDEQGIPEIIGTSEVQNTWMSTQTTSPITLKITLVGR